MLARYVKCHVHRGMAETIAPVVFAHEVEILKDVHGDGNVTIVDKMEEHSPVEVDKGEEVARLTAYYGSNQNGQYFVERVYGRNAEGLDSAYELFEGTATMMNRDAAPRRGRPRKDEYDVS